MKIDSSSFIDKSAKVNATTLGVANKIYRNADIRASTLGKHVTIGDDSILINSSLKGHNAINRRNFIQNSHIGLFCYSGFNTVIRAVQMENFCSISWNVSIGGKNHDMENVTTSAIWGFHNMYGTNPNPISKTVYKDDIAPCTIGNDVLISSNAVVLRDVRIGNGAVIGAGAVVTKDVEPYAVVAGVPAKKIKMRFDDKTIEALEELQWWNWPIETIRKNLNLIYSTKVDKHVIEQLKEIKSKIK